MWTNTHGSSFSGADFTGARRFFLSREIIVEILRKAVGSDVEKAGAVGMITVAPELCYTDWKRLLEARPHLKEAALEALSAYPDSGFSRALENGWRPANNSVSDEVDASAERE